MIMYGAGAGKDGSKQDVVLKKGPWTEVEDEMLVAYVREHGEGNWNAVQKKTWLARCGKSCRLRWTNHLRPNLRKGSFTPEEERLIIQLHAQLGNKWARMAAQLPGRTDNEIKNYWNTRLKKFQRQGLPLYPLDILTNIHYHDHHDHQNHNQHQEKPSSRPAAATSSSSFTFPIFPPLFQPLSPQPKRYQTPLNCTVSTSSTFNLLSEDSYSTFFVSSSLNPSTSSSPNFLHTHFSPSSYQSTNSMKMELPLNQTQCSTVYEGNNFIDNDRSNQSCNSDLHTSSCQLLEDLMKETEPLAGGYRASKRRKVMTLPEENNEDDDNFFSEQRPKEEEFLQINSTLQEEDILKLLDWGSESGEISNEQATEDNLVLDDHQFTLLFPVDDTVNTMTHDEDENNTNNNLTVSCSWDNLPEIC